MKKNRNLHFFFFIVFIVISILLASRTLFIVVLFLFFFSRNGLGLKLPKFYGYLSMVIILLVVSVLNLDSIVGRLFIWKNIITQISHIPLSGFGADTFKEVYANWQMSYFDLHKEVGYFHKVAESPSYAFNEILHFYIEYGVITLIMFIVITACNYKMLFSEKSKISQTCALSNLVIITFSLVSYPLHSIWVILIFLINHLIIILEYAGFAKLLKGAVALSIVSFFLLKTYGYYKAKANWQYAKIIPVSETNDKENYYNAAAKHLKNNPYFLNDFCTYLLSEKRNLAFFEIANSYKKYFNQYEYFMLVGDAYLYKKDYDSASTCFKKAHLIIPSRFVPIYNLMKIASNSNDVFLAKKYARQIISMPIKIINPISFRIIEEAKLYLKNS